VAAFYNKLKQAGVLEDTVSVVMGDHLFMNNPEQNHLFPEREERRVYFNYRSPGGEVCEFGGQDMTHFDVAPTLLALLAGSQIRQMGVGDNQRVTLQVIPKSIARRGNACTDRFLILCPTVGHP